MSNFEIGLWSFPALLVLLFLRIPIGPAMALIGFCGTWLVTGTPTMVLAQLKNMTFGTFANYSFSIIPLFLLMGQFATISGMSRDLFKAAEAWLGHLKGGVAMSAVGACAGFGSICGSSLATAATMGQVALPELKRYGYSGRLATGTLAAGGTLGILIPPSVVLVIYAILTELNIAKLFVAAMVPGVLAAAGYMITIAILVRLENEAGTVLERKTFEQRLIALLKVWPVLTIFFAVVGGIYFGFFTPTEAAGMGAAGAIAIAYFRGALSLQVLLEVARETTMTTAKLFLVVFGAMIFSNFVNRAGLPDGLLNIAQGFDFPPLGVIFMILLIYLVLGCVFESLSMILLTVPIFAPLVEGLGFDLIWFGILVVVATEISLITPPIGMNVFVLKGVLKDVSVKTIFKGVTPFWIADIFRITLIALVPAIALLLPSMMQ